MKRYCLYILQILVLSSVSIAQEQGTGENTEVLNPSEWEKLLETISQDEDMSPLTDDLTFLENHPLDINKASQEELQRIPAITHLLAFRIISRRAIVPLTQIEDLLTIEGISPELCSFIRPFVRIGKSKSKRAVQGNYLSRVSSELEERKGFSSGKYPGPRAKVLNRIHLTFGKKEIPLSSVISDVDVGFVAEKDPGEQNLDSFTAGYASLSIPVLSTQLLLGDYQVEAGEGLVLWRSSAFSKGSNVISPARKNGGGIHPYFSTDENSFLRGIAASVDIEMMKFQLWYSQRPINANIDSMGQISSLDRTGLFRTNEELIKRKAAREAMIGFRGTALFFDGWKIGGTVYRTRFSKPLIINTTKNQNVIKLSVQGVDLSYTNRNLDVFTEISMDQESSTAVIGGITYQPNSKLALTCLGRKYPKIFLGIHGNAFGETGGQSQNEEGIYCGVKIQPFSWFSISSYYDQYRSPGATKEFSIPLPGNDFMALAEIKMGKQYELGLKYKKKESSSKDYQEDVYGRNVQKTMLRVQENYRLTSEFVSSSSFRMSNRMEVAIITYMDRSESEQGFLLSQSIKWKFFSPLLLQARVTIFETNSYDSRIYEFEEDLPGSYSNPALFGKGIRCYFILRYEVFSRTLISCKFSQTIKDGITSFGTGFDEIKGNTLSNLCIQMNIQL